LKFVGVKVGVLNYELFKRSLTSGENCRSTLPSEINRPLA